MVQLKDDGTGTPAPAAARATGFSIAYSPEYRDLRPNQFMLNQLAAASLAPDGVSLAGLFTDERKPTRRLEDAWELFTLIALLLWLIDVAVRRLAFDWQEIRAAAAAMTAGAGGRRALRTRESLAGLLGAKSRAASQMTKQKQGIQDSRSADEQPGPQEADAPVQPQAAPKAAPQASQGSGSGLSELRKKLKGEDRAPRAAPKSFTPEAPSQPSQPPTEKKKADKDISARDFTSTLLKKKRERERDD